MNAENERDPTRGAGSGPGRDEVVVHEPGDEERAEQAVEELVHSLPRAEELAPMVEELAAPDAADTLESLEPERSAEVLTQMEEESAAEALAHMDPALAATVLLDLEAEEAAGFIEEMEPDDAADLLQALPRAACESILQKVDRQRAAVLGKLALYDPKSAGGIMTTDILVVRAGMTIGQAIEYIRTHLMKETQTEVYVVDEGQRLVGTISLRQLLFADDNESVSSHMVRDLDAVLPTVPREEVADLFQKYDYITLPVVDEDRRILGMVTVDDVMDIISAARAEDPLKLVGVRLGEAAYSPVLTKFRGRWPWNLMNLLTAQAASAVLLMYHQFIELIPIVAVVYPVIANASGNTGQQSLAVALRGLVLGQVRRGLVARLLLREMAVGALIGMLVGTVFALSITALDATGLIPEMSWRLGVVAGLAMTGAMTVGCLVGSAIPIVLDRLGFDPATASSIFLTMLTDSLSYAVFLTIAFVLHGWIAGGPP